MFPLITCASVLFPYPNSKIASKYSIFSFILGHGGSTSELIDTKEIFEMLTLIWTIWIGSELLNPRFY